MRAVLLSTAGTGVLLGAGSSLRSLVLHREITKPLVPIGKATTLLVEVLGLLCKGMVSAWGLWLLAAVSRTGILPGGQVGIEPHCLKRGW